MVSLSDVDFQPLHSFPLRWRWTDPKHRQFPQEILERIRPLTLPKAEEVWLVCWPLTSHDTLTPELFTSVTQCDASVESRSVAEWLAGLPIRRDETVLLSWEKDRAASAPYGV